MKDYYKDYLYEDTPTAIDVIELLMKGGNRKEAERVINLIETIKYQQGRLEACILDDDLPKLRKLL